MDLLKEGMKNISLYEVKKQVRKAQNVVLNFSEIEGKVREATNNEPWGTSSKKMQEIADATFNFRDREEICGLLFRRFTEKTASEWRQIYKSLILLEFLVKHGSERFVDDARNNSTLVARLKSFQYIDSKGVDQGRNIRNRAKLLMALLNDENKIRSERKKARENSKKFKGVSGGAPVPGMSANLNFGYARDYDGEENDDNMIYGDGGVYGQRFEQQRAAPPIAGNSQSTFEEYDVRPGRPNRALRQKPTPPTPNPQETTPDLFSFDDDDNNTAATSSTQNQQQPQGSLFDLDDILSNNNNTNSNNNDDEDDDDDFADFQSAVATPSVQQQQQKNVASTITSNYDLLGGLSMNNSNNNTYSLFAASTVNSTNNNILGGFGTTGIIGGTSSTTTVSNNAPKPDAFSSLFSSAKMSSNNIKPKTTTNGSTSSNNNNNLDDLFGDFNSKPATIPTPATASTNSNTNSSNDLDLLSF